MEWRIHTKFQISQGRGNEWAKLTFFQSKVTLGNEFYFFWHFDEETNFAKPIVHGNSEYTGRFSPGLSVRSQKAFEMAQKPCSVSCRFILKIFPNLEEI